jgi:hypothetical protein
MRGALKKGTWQKSQWWNVVLRAKKGASEQASWRDWWLLLKDEVITLVISQMILILFVLCISHKRVYLIIKCRHACPFQTFQNVPASRQ